MTPRALLVLLCVSLGLVAVPKQAQAQYKNRSLGFDLSYQLISKPTIYAADGNYLPSSGRGNRLNNGIKLGGEGSFKLHRDHWWFNARIDFSLLGFGRPKGDSDEAISTRVAADALGTMLGVGGLAGVRYYFLTDHFRPYLQLSLSYMHIFPFGPLGSKPCYPTDSPLCTGGTYGQEFLPKTNILAVHATPSFEFIIHRDVALHVILDYQRWVVFSGQGNNVFTVGAGLLFYG